MRKPTISLCMIVKNEAEYLEGALRSAQDLVDEMVVVDTGSRDGTGEIARSLGACFVEAPWQGDFAAARNESIAHATGDWVLVLDADERIAADDHARLRALVSAAPSQAYLLPQRTYMWESATVGWIPSGQDYVEAGAYPGYIENHQVRLFPRLPGLRYAGAVHESLEASCATLNLPVAVGEVPVHHYGKVRSREYLLRKAELYFELGVKKMNSNVDDVKAAFELGVQLAELDCTAEARQVFEQIVAAAPQHSGARNMLGVMLTRLSETDAAIRTLQSVVDREPGFADAWNNLGIAYLHDDQVSNATISLETAVQCDAANANAWVNLAVARAEGGLFDEALEAARSARSLGDNLGKVRLLEVVVREKRGDHASARKLLKEAASDQVYFSPDDVLNFFQLSHQLGVESDHESFLDDHFDVVSSNRDVAIHLAHLLESCGYLASAEKLLRLIEDRHPGWAPASNMLGYVLAGEGDYTKALERFATAVEKDPSNTDYVKNVALACEKLGMTKKALIIYQRLASMSPDCIPYSRERLLALRRTSQAGGNTPQFVKVEEGNGR